MREFQSNYFRGFPEIPLLHEWVKRQLIEYSSITTPFGFRRHFFGRPTEDSTIREAIAFGPQSMTAKEINIGTLALFAANRVQLLVQVHDSILFQYPEELEDKIVPWAVETVKAPLELKFGRKFIVPTEAKVGWNWGDENTDPKKGLLNPDGLVKYKGHDNRKRTESPRITFR